LRPVVEIGLEHHVGLARQELQHRAFADLPEVVEPVHDLVVNVGRAALVHHLGLLLRIEILRDVAHDPHQLALPVLEAGRELLDEIQQVLFRQAELAPRQLHLGRDRAFGLRLLGKGSPQIVVGRPLVLQALLGPLLLGREARPGTPAIAVDRIVHQRVRRVDHPLHRGDAVLLLAARDIGLGEIEVVENAVRVGPFLEQVVVLEEMIVAEGGVRHDQRLHGHGVLLHDVADAGVGIDDDLIGEAGIALAVHGLVAREALAERPVVIEHRHADRGVGVQHLLGADHLHLDRIGVQLQLVDRDVLDRVERPLQGVEVPFPGLEQQRAVRARTRNRWPVRRHQATFWFLANN
jgi:hypothetical protein